MPELLIDFITSLDGYASVEGWPGWWGLEGPEYLAWLEGQPEADYTVLMGATTYRLMSGLATGGEPGPDVLATMSKVVFSTTLTEPLAWPNTRLVHQDVEAVREMNGSERIYDGYPDVALDMIDSCTFDGRIQLLEYAPTTLDGPAGPSTGNARGDRDARDLERGAGRPG